MTPAIELANAKRIQHMVHSYEHDPSTHSFGAEAAECLGVDATRIFKTLLVESANGRLLVGVVPVSSKLSLKAIAHAAGEKKVEMADRQKVQRVTGYVLGGVSPLGQKKRLTTIIDETARCFDTIYVSAGRRGLEIELSPSDLIALTNGTLFDIAGQ